MKQLRRRLYILSHFLLGMSIVKSQCDPMAVSNITTGCAPLTVLFNIPAFNSGTALWTPATSTASGFSTSLFFPTPGVNIVTVTTVINTQTGTCQGTTTLAINVVTGPAFGCSTTVTGIRSISGDSEISIFSNPATKRLNISVPFANLSDLRFTITNHVGQKIIEGEILGDLTSVPILELPPGLYFISLENNSNSG